jgi:hypothetical protein
MMRFREIAKIRQELRARLMAETPDGTGQIIDRFAILAADDIEMRSEVERWRIRFELLSCIDAPKPKAA